MGQRNRFGLDRYIPAEAAREVRKRCGFGCVNCGAAISAYHHFDPVFKDAERHVPNGIALLCGGCHDRHERGQLSAESLRRSYDRPFCIESGHCQDAFDISNDRFEVVAGSVTSVGAGAILRVYGDSILAIVPPEAKGGPFRLNASLYDTNGSKLLWIEDNIWRADSTNWDVDVQGRRISIRQDIRDISLILRTEPPHRIVLERLKMIHRGVSIECKEGDHLSVTLENGHSLKCGTGSFQDYEAAFDSDKTGIHLGTNHQSAEFDNISYDTQQKD